MYRNGAMRNLLGVETEGEVDAMTDRVLLKEGQTESTFPSYSLRFCKPEEAEDALKEFDLNIILSSSGMCDVGPIVPHLVRELPREDATIVLTGYASPETLGGKLRDASREKVDSPSETLALGDLALPVGDVHATIEDLGAYYSGHADSEGLLDFIFLREEPEGARANDVRVFLNHGDNSKREALARLINERANKANPEDCRIHSVELPARTSTWFDLDREEWIASEPMETPEDFMQSMLLKIFLEQRRTNDLLAEMLRAQQSQQRKPSRNPK